MTRAGAGALPSKPMLDDVCDLPISGGSVGAHRGHGDRLRRARDHARAGDAPSRAAASRRWSIVAVMGAGFAIAVAVGPAAFASSATTTTTVVGAADPDCPGSSVPDSTDAPAPASSAEAESVVETAVESVETCSVAENVDTVVASSEAPETSEAPRRCGASGSR